MLKIKKRLLIVFTYFIISKLKEGEVKLTVVQLLSLGAIEMAILHIGITSLSPTPRVQEDTGTRIKQGTVDFKIIHRSRPFRTQVLLSDDLPWIPYLRI